METRVEVLKLESFMPYLVPRDRDSNKGHFGHVLVVGGDYGYSGAARLAGEAALRVGAGLVSIATRPEHAMVLNVARPELMCHGVSETSELASLMEKASVIIAGPGMGRGVWAQKLLYAVLRVEKPVLVMDADGLNWLADKPSRNDHWILTPHPGEAARLLRKSVEEIQKDRLVAAVQLQQKYGGICVLKGAETLIVDADTTAICHFGNPGMSTGGMGDVLCGVIGGLLAQSFSPSLSAKMGVVLHAIAGDQAAKEGGERGMIASDLLPFLRKLMNISSVEDS